MFKVPEKYRFTDKGDPLSTTIEDGRNGVFIIPASSLYHVSFKRGIFKITASNIGDWEHLICEKSIKGAEQTPTWEDMCQIKRLFWEQKDCVMQFHRNTNNYLKGHFNALHLWRPKSTVFPIPPIEK